MTKKAYLILQNGRVFEGTPFGAIGEATAELVFTTSMTGYLETLTDPSYYGQLVIQTFPLIGNVGVIPGDFESAKACLSGYIVREWCRYPSNYRSEGELDTFLAQQGICGLQGVDTRAITRIVRENGVMNARISLSPTLSASEREALDAYQVTGAFDAVTIPVPVELPAMPGVAQTGMKIAVYDFGAKANIARNLQARGAKVIMVPASYTASQVLALNPDGIVLTNGPGDPADNPGVIANIRELAYKKIPMMGICMGHQILALAFGGKTEKMKYGHRGANQPVTDSDTGRVYVTSQNHGYHVIDASLPSFARPVMHNANDGSNEGIRYEGYPAFSVQFHPEASGGPLDTGFLFDEFIESIQEGHRHATR